MNTATFEFNRLVLHGDRRGEPVVNARTGVTGGNASAVPFSLQFSLTFESLRGELFV